MSSLAIVAEKTETERPLVGGYEAHPDIPTDEVIRLAAFMEQVQTEDNQPVDNILSERLMHLLVETLNTSWKPLAADGSPRSFLALSNVGLFYSIYESHIVPDVMLSLDVKMPEAIRVKADLSYFTWVYGKLPEVVIEIVSPTAGREDAEKLRRYERIGIEYYAIFDPLQTLGNEMLRTFQLRKGVYEPCPNHFFANIGLGLKLWAGTYWNLTDEYWLRWCDQHGVLLPIATERIEQEAERAEREAERADREAERAEREAERSAMLAVKLRELGIDPDKF
jgi:Uma2 family endonuclease